MRRSWRASDFEGNGMSIDILKRWNGEVVFRSENASTQWSAVREAAGTRADLFAADLKNADLSGADLFGLRLAEADLTGAKLGDTNLDGVNLMGAAGLIYDQLKEARLVGTRADFWGTLALAPLELPEIRKALVEGRVDGTTRKGKYACLIGTVANIRGCDVDTMPDLKLNHHSLSGTWFLAIRPGDTPDNSAVCRITVEWLDDFVSRMEAAFGRPWN